MPLAQNPALIRAGYSILGATTKLSKSISTAPAAGSKATNRMYRRVLKCIKGPSSVNGPAVKKFHRFFPSPTRSGSAPLCARLTGRSILSSKPLRRSLPNGSAKKTFRKNQPATLRKDQEIWAVCGPGCPPGRSLGAQRPRTIATEIAITVYRPGAASGHRPNAGHAAGARSPPRPRVVQAYSTASSSAARVTGTSTA